MSGRQEIMKCNICLETMTDGRMLPSCGHMFCLGCLESFVGYKRELQCPVCREKCRVPSGGIRSFPKNIYLNQFLEQLCEQCEKYPRTDRCPHCEKMMCEKCKDSHMGELRDELTDVTKIVEMLNDVKITKDAKREKKILNDRQKTLEKEITKTAEDMIKMVRNQEKKLKTQLKSGVMTEIKDIDTKVKTYQDGIATLKQFTKKYDVRSMADEKLKEMKTTWSSHYHAILDTLDEDIAVAQKDVACTVDLDEVETAITDSWKLLHGDGSEVSLRSVGRLSVCSTGDVPPSPKLKWELTPMKTMPSCVFGSNGVTKGRLQSPFGVSISPISNEIIVADTHNHRLQTFNRNGQVNESFGSSGTGNGQFAHPIGTTCMRNGDHIVADTENHRIVLLDSQGRFLRTFGKDGNGVNDFHQPWGLAIDSTNQNIHIGDCGNNRIQVVNIYGRYIRTIGQNDLKSPTGIAIDKNDDIYVADCDNHRIVVYSKYGTQKRTFGTEGSKQGQLSSPCDVALDQQEHVVVAEWGNHRVQVFTKEGRSLRVFGRKGFARGEFKEPRGVAVMTDGTIVVCDCGNDRIQLF